MNRMLRSVPLLLSLAVGCSQPSDKATSDATKSTTEPASTSTGEPGSTGGTSSAAGTTTDGPDPTTEAATGSTGEPGGSTGALPPSEKECDVWEQDCPEGQKCTAWANDGSEHWNATHCVPVVENPALPGDPCQVEEGVASGIDNCAEGSFCWFIDHQSLAGICIESCKGSPESWTCPGGQHCDISNDGTLLLCLQTCDPLVPSCPNGQICFNSIDGSQFICDTPNAAVMDMPGMYGDPCNYVNACAYGLFCAYPEEVPNCNNDYGCCSEFCDVNAENTCSGKDGGQQCVAWFADGQASPGLEHIGYCTIPQ